MDPSGDRQALVVMGVAGSGKTTVAQALALRLGWPCADADDFHPEANKAKMSAGVPLTDEDRWPWLESIRDWLSAQLRSNPGAVVTCSALRLAYRDVLRGAAGRVRFVQLDGPKTLLQQRIGDRAGHFMPAAMLDSQLDTLEPLGPGEDGVLVSIAGRPAEIVDHVITGLGLDVGPGSATGRSGDGGH